MMRIDGRILQPLQPAICGAPLVTAISAPQPTRLTRSFTRFPNKSLTTDSIVRRMEQRLSAKIFSTTDRVLAIHRWWVAWIGLDSSWTKNRKRCCRLVGLNSIQTALEKQIRMAFEVCKW